MLSAINPTYSKFGCKKCRELISDIYSVMDEAYGLLVIYNEHHVWKEQEVMKQNCVKGTVIKKPKELCSRKNGNKQGWLDADLNLFNSLCHQVEVIHNIMVDVEKQIKQQFVDKSSINKGKPIQMTQRQMKKPILLVSKRTILVTVQMSLLKSIQKGKQI